MASWRDAFLEQARSDMKVFNLLNAQKHPRSHQLHYLQMATEKLAKSLLLDPNSTNPPKITHKALTRALRCLKQRPEIRTQLGYKDKHDAFGRFIDSIMPIADKIENLAPSATGLNAPNPEYPWQPTAAGAVICPANYAFPEIDPKDTRMIKMVALIDRLLKIIH